MTFSKLIYCSGVLAVACSVAIAQEVRVKANVAVSPNGGWHPLYEMKIDPDNSANMIVCGIRSDGKDNALYGFVYSSGDGGKTWRQTFEDKNSTFESEQSCAFGVHGVAYYVASASKVIDDEPQHERGTTRIYVSRDSGRTWKLGVATGWTDWSTSVVDIQPGSNQNRLYIFFNNLWTFYTSVGNDEAAKRDGGGTGGHGAGLGMISYRDGDPAVSGPFTSEEMAKTGYGAAFPGPAITLNDNAMLTFFSSKRKAEKGQKELTVEVVRTDSMRSALETPVKVVDSLNIIDKSSRDKNIECGDFYLSSAAAYDPIHNRLYFAYPAISADRCRLFLARSIDDGRAWSSAEVYVDNSSSHTYRQLALAVNHDGVLGVVWKDRVRSGCWTFASSIDNGKTLTRNQRLGACSDEPNKNSALTNAYFWTTILQASLKQASITVELRDTWNDIWRNQDAIVATPDGAFNILWSDGGNGDGELRTAAVQVIPADTLIATEVRGLEDVTTEAAVLYGGDQNYDSKTKMLTLDVMVKNNGNQPLKGSLKLVVSDLYINVGQAEIANADNNAPDAGAVWDITSTVPDGVLAPGASTRPFTLKFHYLGDPDAREADNLFELGIKVYANSRLRAGKLGIKQVEGTQIVRANGAR